MAEKISLDINVISAKDLQDVNFITKMDVYAVVSIAGDPNSQQPVKSDVDRGCGTFPTWNFPVKLFVDESLARSNRLTLVVRLVCERSLGDKDVGEINVPVKELLDSVNTGSSKTKFVSYQVRKPSGRGKGELNFSYRLGDKPGKASRPAVTSSYAPPPITGSAVHGGLGNLPPPTKFNNGNRTPPFPRHGYGYKAPHPPSKHGGC